MLVTVPGLRRHVRGGRQSGDHLGEQCLDVPAQGTPDELRGWPQTEWIKSAVRLAAMTQGAERERYIASAVKGCAALQLFLDTPVRGLWWDKQKSEGIFIDEPAPASTFYHILCAVYELDDCLKRL